MGESLLVSICMPAYNAGKYIKQTVDSIIAQTYQNWELIIVNDGSKDDTAAVLRRFTDPRIKTYYQENSGQCAAANAAFAFSVGEVIKFMDADDLISSDLLANQIKDIEGKQDVVACADWGRFYNDDLTTFKPANDQLTDDLPPLDWLIQSMSNKEVMLQCARWLIPRNVLEKSGLWLQELSLINDFEFFIRVLLNARTVKHTADGAVFYRSGLPGSLSASNSDKAAKSAYDSINWGTQHLLNAANTPQTREISADCFQRFIYGFYPNHKLLLKDAEAKVKELGGSDIPFPAGGITKVLASILGWKLVKKIKQILLLF